MGVPWTARRSNQSVLKEINPEYLLKGLILKPKLQYFGYLMQRVSSLEKILMLRKTECKRRRGQQRMRQLDDIIDSKNMSLSRFPEMMKDREARPSETCSSMEQKQGEPETSAAIHGAAKSQTRPSN